MRLRRVSVEGPGIVRRRRGRGFSYEDTAGRAPDEETSERIRALAIPPAWTDVWICPQDDGHIQAVGTDAAGRRQYLYHEHWRTRRDAAKFDRMIAFAKALPALRERVDEDLHLRGMPKDRALACAVRLLDHALFRVGSEVYTKRNGSFGLATLRKDHVHVGRHRIVFDFTAKSGKRQRFEVRDAVVRPAIVTMKRRRGGGRDLLAYREGRRWRDVRSSDINEYVRERGGDGFTAKDFRTWHATVLAAAALATKAEEATPLTSKARQVSAAVKEVAAALGNTPAVARASYIDPRVIERFEQGATISPTLRRRGIDPLDPELRGAVERAVLELLEEEPSSSVRAA